MDEERRKALERAGLFYADESSPSALTLSEAEWEAAHSRGLDYEAAKHEKAERLARKYNLSTAQVEFVARNGLDLETYAAYQDAGNIEEAQAATEKLRLVREARAEAVHEAALAEARKEQNQ